VVACRSSLILDLFRSACWDYYHAIDENARSVDRVRIQITCLDNGFVEFNNCYFGRAGHDGSEVSLREPELQVAYVIGFVGMNA
jgi:hypothetical protein